MSNFDKRKCALFGFGPTFHNPYFMQEWFQVFSNVHPYLGKIPILTHIFSKGLFNHQLD